MEPVIPQHIPEHQAPGGVCIVVYLGCVVGATYHLPEKNNTSFEVAAELLKARRNLIYWASVLRTQGVMASYDGDSGLLLAATRHGHPLPLRSN